MPPAREPGRTGGLCCAPLRAESRLIGTVPSCHLVPFGGPQAPAASPTPVFPASRCPAVGTPLCRRVNPRRGERAARVTELSGGSKFPPGSCGPSRAQGTRPPTRPPAPAARPPSGFICVPSFSSCNFQASAGSARSRGRSVNDYRHRRSEQPRPTGAVGQSALQAGRRGGGTGHGGHTRHHRNHPAPRSGAGARRFGQGTPRGVSSSAGSTCCRRWGGFSLRRARISHEAWLCKINSAK